MENAFFYSASLLQPSWNRSSLIDKRRDDPLSWSFFQWINSTPQGFNFKQINWNWWLVFSYYIANTNIIFVCIHGERLKWYLSKTRTLCEQVSWPAYPNALTLRHRDLILSKSIATGDLYLARFVLQQTLLGGKWCFKNKFSAINFSGHIFVAEKHPTSWPSQLYNNIFK